MLRSTTLLVACIGLIVVTATLLAEDECVQVSTMGCCELQEHHHTPCPGAPDDVCPGRPIASKPTNYAHFASEGYFHPFFTTPDGTKTCRWYIAECDNDSFPPDCNLTEQIDEEFCDNIVKPNDPYPCPL